MRLSTGAENEMAENEKMEVAFTCVDKTYYDSLTSNGLLYDNANVFLGGFDDKKQERKHKNK